MRVVQTTSSSLRSNPDSVQTLMSRSQQMQRGRLLVVQPDGDLIVDSGLGSPIACDVLLSSPPVDYCEGDEVLLFVPAELPARGVVLGRIGLYAANATLTQVSIEAAESISLKCGLSSIDLRADGKVMIRGEDVLLRAKGTQRIRAGTVSIN